MLSSCRVDGLLVMVQAWLLEVVEVGRQPEVFVRPLGPGVTPGCHHVTAVVTATNSTALHPDTTRRTPHARVAWSDPGLACIC